jgi:hypothetical protein
MRKKDSGTSGLCSETGSVHNSILQVCVGEELYSIFSWVTKYRLLIYLLFIGRNDFDGGKSITRALLCISEVILRNSILSYKSTKIEEASTILRIPGGN